jgi:hypothetical protein
MKSELLREE